MVASGPIGLIDAALVRYLESVTDRNRSLRVHVTESLYPTLFRRQHLEFFLSAFAIVDAIEERCSRRFVRVPHEALTAYSIDRIFKRVDVRASRCSSERKLCTLDALAERYSSGSLRVAVVAGSFDVLHPGHVCLMQQAKSIADVLIVAMQSTSSLVGQPKNRNGDRPIYSEHDRVSLVAALSCVDDIVLFDELDCRRVLEVLRPGLYVKHERDRGRDAVEQEAAVVRGFGGRVIYVSHPPFGCSSGAIIEWFRRNVAAHRSKKGGHDGRPCES